MISNGRATQIAGARPGNLGQGANQGIFDAHNRGEFNAQRQKSAYPERFTDRHHRTVQRAVKAWRGQQARRIIVESSIVVGAGVRDPLPAEPIAPPPPDPHPGVSPTGAHSDPPRIAPSDS